MRRLFVALLLLIFSIVPVCAQKDPLEDPLTASFLWDGDAAILPGSPVFIASNPAYEITPCPLGRYALVSWNDQKKLPLDLQDAGKAPSNPTEYRLYLWSSAKEKVTTVWKYFPRENETLLVQEPYWIPGTSTALYLVTRYVDDNIADHSLVTINAVQGSSVTRVLKYPNRILALSVHPSKPVMYLYTMGTTQDQAPVLLWKVKSDGILQEPITLPTNLMIFPRWFENDDHVYGRLRPKDETETRQNVAIDLTTGKVEKVANWPAKPIVANPEAEAAKKNLPFQILSTTGKVVTDAEPKDKNETTVYPLFLVEKPTGATATKPRRLLIDPIGLGPVLLPDGSAVLYVNQAGVFATPLYRFDKALVDARILERKKRYALANAKQIDSGLQQWMMDNKAEDYPASGTDILGLLVGADKYIRSGDAFYDPVTGKSNFTYLYNGKPDKTGNKPIFAFEGPGGRYVMYAKGDPVWEPNPK